MAGELERRSHGDKLVALEPIGDQVLLAPIGDIDEAAVGAESDAFGQRADFGLPDLAYGLAVAL
jgi:hypothetical protein